MGRIQKFFCLTLNISVMIEPIRLKICKQIARAICYQTVKFESHRFINKIFTLKGILKQIFPFFQESLPESPLKYFSLMGQQ
jgi:hypothetical protein